MGGRFVHVEHIDCVWNALEIFQRSGLVGVRLSGSPAVADRSDARAVVRRRVCDATCERRRTRQERVGLVGTGWGGFLDGQQVLVG